MRIDINKLQHLSQQALTQKLPKVLTQSGLSFQQILSETMAATQGAVTTNQVKDFQREVKKKQGNTLVAQVAQPAIAGQPVTLNRVPLQLFLDRAVQALNAVSEQEFRVNDLIEQFIRGEVSEDAVVMETAKLNLSMTMITTIIQSAVQTFKEIQNIPV